MSEPGPIEKSADAIHQYVHKEKAPKSFGDKFWNFFGYKKILILTGEEENRHLTFGFKSILFTKADDASIVAVENFYKGKKAEIDKELEKKFEDKSAGESDTVLLEKRFTHIKAKKSETKASDTSSKVAGVSAKQSIATETSAKTPVSPKAPEPAFLTVEKRKKLQQANLKTYKEISTSLEGAERRHQVFFKLDENGQILKDDGTPPKEGEILLVNGQIGQRSWAAKEQSPIAKSFQKLPFIVSQIKERNKAGEPIKSEELTLKQKTALLDLLAAVDAFAFASKQKEFRFQGIAESPDFSSEKLPLFRVPSMSKETIKVAISGFERPRGVGYCPKATIGVALCGYTKEQLKKYNELEESYSVPIVSSSKDGSLIIDIPANLQRSSPGVVNKITLQVTQAPDVQISEISTTTVRVLDTPIEIPCSKRIVVKAAHVQDFLEKGLGLKIYDALVTSDPVLATHFVEKEALLDKSVRENKVDAIAQAVELLPNSAVISYLHKVHPATLLKVAEKLSPIRRSALAKEMPILDPEKRKEMLRKNVREYLNQAKQQTPAEFDTVNFSLDSHGNLLAPDTPQTVALAAGSFIKKSHPLVGGKASPIIECQHYQLQFSSKTTGRNQRTSYSEMQQRALTSEQWVPLLDMQAHLSRFITPVPDTMQSQFTPESFVNEQLKKQEASNIHHASPEVYKPSSPASESYNHQQAYIRDEEGLFAAQKSISAALVTKVEGGYKPEDIKRNGGLAQDVLLPIVTVERGAAVITIPKELTEKKPNFLTNCRMLLADLPYISSSGIYENMQLGDKKIPCVYQFKIPKDKVQEFIEATLKLKEKSTPTDAGLTPRTVTEELFFNTDIGGPAISTPRHVHLTATGELTEGEGAPLNRAAIHAKKDEEPKFFTALASTKGPKTDKPYDSGKNIVMDCTDARQIKKAIEQGFGAEFVAAQEPYTDKPGELEKDTDLCRLIGARKPQDLEFLAAASAAKVTLSGKALEELQSRTAQYYTDASGVDSLKAREVMGCGKELLGFNPEGRKSGMLDLESLYSILDGTSQAGPETVGASHLVSVSQDHIIANRKEWLGDTTGGSLDEREPITIMSRPGVNNSYGENGHDAQDFAMFHDLEKHGELDRVAIRHFENQLKYKFFLDCCVAEERGIEYPTFGAIGCGAFATDKNRKDIQEATARAYRFVCEFFPFKNVKGVVLTPFGPNYDAFKKVFQDYSPEGHIPVELIDRDMMTIPSIAISAAEGGRKGVATCLQNAADSHKLPGEYFNGKQKSVEEGLGRSTTLVLTQHPDLNPTYALSKGNYYGFDLSSVVDVLYEMDKGRVTESAKRKFKADFGTHLADTLETHTKEAAKFKEELQRKQEICEVLNKKLKRDPSKDFCFTPNLIEIVQNHAEKYQIRFRAWDASHRALQVSFKKEFPTYADQFTKIEKMANSDPPRKETFYHSVSIYRSTFEELTGTKKA
jgi:hypothetical protein